MTSLLETGQKIDIEPAQKQGVTPEKFWALRGKNPLPIAEITRKYPQEISPLLRYQEDLQSFLSQNHTANLCRKIGDLQAGIGDYQTQFSSKRQELELAKAAIVRQGQELVQGEKDRRREISTEQNNFGVVFNRLRVEVYERKGKPDRPLLEKALAGIPKFAIKTHPELLPIKNAQKELELRSQEIDEHGKSLAEDFEKSISPIQDLERERQKVLAETFSSWVTVNPERLIAHLLQFPDETTPLRKEYYRRHTDPEVQKKLDEKLKGFGLLDGTHTLEKNQNLSSWQTVAERSHQPPVSRWKLSFKDNPERVIAKRTKMVKTIIAALEAKKCPPDKIQILVRSLLKFMDDPLGEHNVDGVANPEIRRELGTHELRLPDGWRVFYDLLPGRNIIVGGIMSHGEWDKKQH